MSLSQPLVTVLQEFGSAFSRPTWSKVQVLIVGTLLARGVAALSRLRSARWACMMRPTSASIIMC
jgi:hypothetical protein